MQIEDEDNERERKRENKVCQSGLLSFEENMQKGKFVTVKHPRRNCRRVKKVPE
jgi:hypothetical protein